MDALRVTIALVLATGCLGQTPDDRRRDEIGEGEDDDDEGPEHHPGEPCLLCHGPSPFSREAFAVAGTVYLEQHDTAGIEGAHVFIEDARGRTIEAITNRTGNFYVEVEADDDDGVRIDDRGKTEIGFWPEYPLHVRVTYADLEEEMLSPIRREGSCSECHYREPASDSEGRIWLVEPAP
jgi:hypothetical protein